MVVIDTKRKLEIHVCDWCEKELLKDKNGNYIKKEIKSKKLNKIYEFCDSNCSVHYNKMETFFRGMV